MGFFRVVWEKLNVFLSSNLLEKRVFRSSFVLTDDDRNAPFVGNVLMICLIETFFSAVIHIYIYIYIYSGGGGD